MPPLVSVIMPAFNAGPFIAEAIESILGQTLPDLELLVVDDGSADRTAEIVSANRDPRLRLIRKPHSGLIDSLNRGLSEATGRYFARMDADDVALPERLAAELTLLESGKADVAAGRVEIFRDRGALMPGFTAYQEWLNGVITHEKIVENLFIEDPLPSPTLFMRRKDLLDSGGYDANVYPDDYNLTLKNFKAGRRFAKTEAIILRWRDHDGRFSRTAPELADQRFFKLKAKFFRDTVCPKDRPLVIWGLGRNGKNLFKAFAGEGVSVAGFTAAKRFIREKSLYGAPIRPLEEWPGAYMVLAAAARNAREEAMQILAEAGLKVFKDYRAFC